MAKRFKTQRIRIHQSYEVGEVVDLLNAAPQTVRGWIKDGLPVLFTQRPMLILGFELKAYLDKRQETAKQPTALGEMYCMSCRKPRKPLGMMADYVPKTTTTGLLEALCGVCEGVCMRFTSKASLPDLSRILDIATNDNRQA